MAITQTRAFSDHVPPSSLRVRGQTGSASELPGAVGTPPGKTLRFTACSDWTLKEICTRVSHAQSRGLTGQPAALPGDTSALATALPPA